MKNEKIITGIINRIALEGGFYGIQTEDGTRYDPVSGLPKEMEVDGIHIWARVIPFDGMTLRMWGRPVKILEARIIE